MAQKKAEDALKQVTEVKDMISTMQSSLKEVCTAVGAIGEIQTTLKSVSDSFAVFSEKSIRKLTISQFVPMKYLSVLMLLTNRYEKT